MIAHKPKVLIASSSYCRFPTGALKALEKFKKDYQIIINSFGRRMTSEELKSRGEGCLGIVAGLEQYDAGLLKELSNSLKCVSRDGVGMDNIDLDAARKHKIAVCNTALAATDAVAELTVGLIISLLRGICSLNSNTHQGKWLQIHGNLLKGRTVGIIGVGNIGRKVIQLLRPFDCHVVGYDIKPDLKWFKENTVASVSKDELLKSCDIVTVHAFYQPENYHLINSKFFSRMKKGAFFLNLSRGPMVEEKALVKALKSGKLAGAALDVFEEEPYDGPLSKMENVILTPHIGASTLESRYQMQLGAINNLFKILENGKIGV